MTHYPSYADVAAGLRQTTREAIEVTTPCRGRGVHDWDHDRHELRRWGSATPVHVIEHWHCRECGVTTSTDPKEVRMTVIDPDGNGL